MPRRYPGYLIHFGILGQKWGVRRYQNEDGTLTEEGKQRYYAQYDKMEKEAQKDIDLATSQLNDIAKNGWDAKSAFDTGFVREYARSLGMKRPPDEDLKPFIKTFKDDLATATANRNAARAAKKLIDVNKSVTIDDIINGTKKIDKKSNDKKFTDASKKLAKELGIEYEEEVHIKMPDFDKNAQQRMRSITTTSGMRDIVKQVRTDRDAGPSVAKIKIGGVPFDDLPIEHQFYIVYNLMTGNYEES